jgi:hypothetical protein
MRFFNRSRPSRPAFSGHFLFGRIFCGKVTGVYFSAYRWGEVSPSLQPPAAFYATPAAGDTPATPPPGVEFCEAKLPGSMRSIEPPPLLGANRRFAVVRADPREVLSRHHAVEFCEAKILRPMRSIGPPSADEGGPETRNRMLRAVGRP